MNDVFEIKWSEPLVTKIHAGLPDLTVNVVPAEQLIFVEFPPGSGTRGSTVVNITVQNRLTVIPPRLPIPKLVEAIGSDVEKVEVDINLSSQLHQVGSMLTAAGFVASVAPNQQAIHFFGGPIVAGSSVNFEFEVIGDTEYMDRGSITAEVDPHSLIAEMSKSNNKGSAYIYIVCLRLAAPA